MTSFELIQLSISISVLSVCVVCYFSYKSQIEQLKKIMEDHQSQTTKRFDDAGVNSMAALTELSKKFSDYQKEVLELKIGKEELPSEWLGHINSIPDNQFYAKMDEYIFALVRFPGHSLLFTEFSNYVQTYWQKLSLDQKASMLSSLERVTRKFFENCSHEDYLLKDKVFNWLQAGMQDYKQSVHNHKIELNTKVIMKYQDYINTCKALKGKIGETEVKELQRLESLIDKDLITSLQHKTMNTMLENANHDLINLLKEDSRLRADQEKLEIKNYNKKVLDDLREAQKLIRQGLNSTSKVADIMASIDESKVLHPVAVYKNAVFSEIFKDLGNSEKRESFVRSMVNYQKAG